MIEIISIIIYPIFINKYIKIYISNFTFILTFISISYIGNRWLSFTNYYFFIYNDKFCLILIILTLWIISLSLIIIKKKVILLIRLIFLVIICITSTNIIFFYIWFEIRLIPLFIIIFWWGKTKERVSASIYILIYTIIGSLPLIISIFYIYKIRLSIEWDYLFIFNIRIFRSFIYWNIIIAFLIKIPVFGFHIWLPKAHVEAPVYGSIILARIILKLGSIGLIRIILINFKNSIQLNPFLIYIIILGSLFIRILCITQLDIKIIVAFSSIVHIGVATVSIITINKWGYLGAIILIIRHGLCSSCLFYIVNSIYIRRGSRIILLNKGIINMQPKLRFLWFLTCIRNMGAPISLNFLRELFIINRIIRFRYLIIIPLILINLFRRVYSINLFIYISHGNKLSILIKPIKIREFTIIILHIFPLNWISLNSWLWSIFFYPDSLY